MNQQSHPRNDHLGEDMSNNTDWTDAHDNDVPTVIFSQWPIDIDDDEFRAGYPFSPTSSDEEDGQTFTHQKREEAISFFEFRRNNMR